MNLYDERHVEPGCDERAMMGWCESQSDWMSIQCQLSCGHCDTDTQPLYSKYSEILSKSNFRGPEQYLDSGKFQWKMLLKDLRYTIIISTRGIWSILWFNVATPPLLCLERYLCVLLLPYPSKSVLYVYKKLVIL